MWHGGAYYGSVSASVFAAVLASVFASLSASVALCPPLLFSVANVILSLPLSLSGRTIDKSGRRMEGESGQQPQCTEKRNNRRGHSTRTPDRGRPPRECWGHKTGEWKGAREEARGAGKQTPAGQHPQLGKERAIPANLWAGPCFSNFSQAKHRQEHMCLRIFAWKNAFLSGGYLGLRRDAARAWKVMDA